MDLLIKKDGFTIIETLVTIALLGMLVTFTLTFFNKIYSNPVLILKAEAFKIASDEMDNSISNRLQSDTLYQKNENMLVKRSISNEKSYSKINVIVAFKKDKKVLCKLSSIIKNE